MRRFFGWGVGFTVLVLMGTGVGSAQNWYLSSQADIKSTVGFVGTFLDIARLECPFPNKPFALPFNNQNAVVDGCDGVMYRLRYRVSEVLEGKLKIGDEVSFDVHNYDGTPELADYLNALIFLGVARDGYPPRIQSQDSRPRNVSWQSPETGGA